MVLWLLLTVASVGFALLLAAFSGGPAWLAGAGTAVMAFGGLVFLAVQFATEATQAPARAPRAAAVASGPVAFDMPPVVEPAPTLSMPNGSGATDLVEFKLESVQAPAEAPAGRPEGAWPKVTEDQWRRQRQRDPLPPGEFDLPAAFKKREAFTQDLPLVRSIFEDEPAEPPVPPGREGKTRGQCSSCQTYLWAPKERPIRLRCPKCGKVALLEA